MQEFGYGSNPGQRGFAFQPNSPLASTIGEPSFNNLLDALRAWAIAHRLSEITGTIAAASVKNSLPVGAALVDPVSCDLVDVIARARSPIGVTNTHDAIAVTAALDGADCVAVQEFECDVLIATDFGAYDGSHSGAKGTRFIAASESMSLHPPLGINMHSHYGYVFVEESTSDLPIATLESIAMESGMALESIALTLVVLEHSVHRALVASGDTATTVCIAAGQEESSCISELIDRLSALKHTEQLTVASGVNLSSNSLSALDRAGVNLILQPDTPVSPTAQLPGKVKAFGKRLIRRW